MPARRTLPAALVAALLLCLCATPALAQEPDLSAQAALGSGFTFQGRLLDNGAPVSGPYDLQFRLYNAASGGAALGTKDVPDWTVSGGTFTVTLDFGASPFNGQALWLETAVRPGPSSDPLTTLTPRTPLTAVPYALWSAETRSYANVVVVAKSGGDFTTIQAAVNSITTEGPDNPFLVWVAPGTYDEQVTMKPFVDIRGAGRWMTTITHGGSPTRDQGTVNAADNTELRSLRVVNTGGDTNAIAIYSDASPFRASDLIAVASGASALNMSVANVSTATMLLADVTLSAGGGQVAAGIVNAEESSLVLSNSTVSASVGTVASVGIQNSYSSALIGSSAVTATGDPGTDRRAIGNDAATGSYACVVQHSGLAGATNVIGTQATYTTRVAATQMSGGPVSGPVICAGVYDENYLFYSEICP